MFSNLWECLLTAGGWRTYIWLFSRMVQAWDVVYAWYNICYGRMVYEVKDALVGCYICADPMQKTTVGQHIHNIAPHSHTWHNMADLKKLFKSAFYKWNFITRIQEISLLSTKIATLISTSPVHVNRTSMAANQCILHFIHHMSETDIVPCIINISSLDHPTKQSYIYISFNHVRLTSTLINC